ncbi:MAG: hypothetical protein WDM92_07305 [Caulobacteraceae bacterium]
MGAITIRRLDDAVIARIKERAKAQGRSMEAELRLHVQEAYAPGSSLGERGSDAAELSALEEERERLLGPDGKFRPGPAFVDYMRRPAEGCVRRQGCCPTPRRSCARCGTKTPQHRRPTPAIRDRRRQRRDQVAGARARQRSREALLERADLRAPDSFDLELANALAKLWRHGRLGPWELFPAWEDVARLPVARHDWRGLAEPALDLSAALGAALL